MKASVLSSVWGAFALALAVGTSAGAATLISIQGPVQINSGAGFHQVSGAAQVRPGTSIMVGPGGSAEVLYSDGCRMPAGPGSVVTVAPISPCAQGADLPVRQAAPPGAAPGSYYDPTAYYLVG